MPEHHVQFRRAKYLACVQTPKGPCDPLPSQRVEPANRPSLKARLRAGRAMWPRSLAGWRSSGPPPESGTRSALSRWTLWAERVRWRAARSREPSLRAAILEPELRRLLASGGEVRGRRTRCTR
jgi:hypothetical protein